MVYNDYVKLRILYLDRLGFRPSSIVKALAVENIVVSDRGVAKFIARYNATGKYYALISTFKTSSRHYSTKHWQWQKNVDYRRSEDHS